MNEWQLTAGLLYRRDPMGVTPWVDRVLTEARQLAVDVIVLPELSVPAECIYQLQDWSKLTGGTVIGGSHYHKDSSSGRVVSRCPIVTAGEVLLSEKVRPSPYERSPILNEGLSSGSRIGLIKDSPIGNFAVLICSDYLDPVIRSQVLQSDLDFLFVIACQSESGTYHLRMNSDCEEAENGLYIIYSNCTFAHHGDGRSAVFGLMDRYYSDQLISAGISDGSPKHKVCESSATTDLVVDFDLQNKRPRVPRTIHSVPNIIVAPPRDQPPPHLLASASDPRV